MRKQTIYLAGVALLALSYPWVEKLMPSYVFLISAIVYLGLLNIVAHRFGNDGDQKN